MLEHALMLVAAGCAAFFFCSFARLFSSDAEVEEDSAGKGQGDVQSKQPKPRWEVLRVLNYCVILLFVWSLTYVVFNYRLLAANGTHGLFPVLVIWSICMVYFFGFFGISFLDKNAMVRSPSSFGLAQLEQHLSTAGNATPNTSSAAAAAPGSMCAAEAFTVTKSPTKSKRSTRQQEHLDFASLDDDALVACVLRGALKEYNLEAKLQAVESTVSQEDPHQRAVRIRRKIFEHKTKASFKALPLEGYDYKGIFGANCEVVVGYVPLPVGIVGPLMLDGADVYVPMATTEGCLVASTNRGCKVISQGGGARSVVVKDGITRAPCLRMPDAMSAAAVKAWVEAPAHFDLVRAAFQSTTAFGKLQEIKATVAGRNIYLRLTCFSGDAMGMNMVSKGCLAVVELLERTFPAIELIAISGNMCTDKKPAAINWVEGRGKSVICEARIPARHVESTLKTTVNAMVQTNIQKNLVGSALAGSIGGFNAHAANIVTAVFIAAGQDPAQNVESSHCITLMEQMDNGDLLVSVNMPCIEVGTVGGGTSLPAQGACLDILGCRGASKAPNAPGENARRLARAVGGAVLAGELSLVAALASNQLVRAHMQHNRKKVGSSPMIDIATATVCMLLLLKAPQDLASVPDP
ncbi:unnamed protein product [Chrysoparadoxa australica]